MDNLEIEVTLKLDRATSRELFEQYSAMSLLLSCVDLEESVLLSQFEKGMDKGKKYRITIKEIS
jgi:hypothetical protein